MLFRSVETNLIPVKILPLNNFVLRALTHNRLEELMTFDMLVTPTTKVEDLYLELGTFIQSKSLGIFNFLQAQFQNYRVKDYSIRDIRIWRLDSSQTTDGFFEFLKKECKKTPDYNYKIQVQGEFLLKRPEALLTSMGINTNSIIVIEARDPAKNWNLVGDGAPEFKKCSYCASYFETLPYQCGCKEVK